MKISLINPNLSGDVSILDMGLTYLATFINERTKHKASIIDFTFHRKNWLKHLDAQIKKYQPDVIGITCTSLYMHYVKLMAASVKEKYNLSVVAGGYHSSLETEATLAIKDIDAACIGDGEYALEGYLDALELKRGFDGIDGMWVKDKGKIIRNRIVPPIQDIDSLPLPNYDLWEDIDEYLFFNNLLYFIGNRCCPYSCSYCSELPMRQRIPGKHFRRRDPAAFAREIKYQYDKYKDRHMRMAHTFDPVFTFDLDWLKSFGDEYKAIGMDRLLPISCFSRGDLIDEERIKAFAGAGGRIVRIGVEAGNYHIRKDIYDKDITNEQFIEGVATCKKHGLAITGYYILGGPGESKATLQDTFDFAKLLDVHRPVFFIYQPLPKTRAREKLLELGGEVEMDKMDNIDCLHHASAVRTKDLKPRTVMLFQYKCFVYFVGKRVIRLLLQQKFRLFKNFIVYFVRGRRNNVPLWYTVGYFLICCEENAHG